MRNVGWRLESFDGKLDRKAGRKMIVKIKNGGISRFFDCLVASVWPCIEQGTSKEDAKKLPKQFDIVFTFANGKDWTFELSQDDEIYYMNEQGKTIDRDFRMCE